jgi:hypothetical protein
VVLGGESGRKRREKGRSMPGTIPATSQLERLIPITAISVRSGLRGVRDRLRSFNFCMRVLHPFTSTSTDAISSPTPPHSIFIGGFRTTAGASRIVPGGRHPKPFTEAEVGHGTHDLAELPPAL